MFVFLFLFFSMLLLCSFFRPKELFEMKNGVTTSFPLFFENAKNLGRSDDLYPFSHSACLNIDLVTSVFDYFY